MTETIGNLRAIYDAGEFSRCLEQVKMELAREERRNEDESELLALKAWCSFRLGQGTKDFAAAKQAAHESMSLRGDECLAQIAGVEGDDAELERITLKWPESPGVANATVIRARDAKSKISHEVVEGIAERFGKPEHGLTGANIVRNAGAFKLAKSRGERDLLDAATYFGKSLSLYGDKNFHHRAGVHNLRREVYEKLGRANAAFDCALDSFALWFYQCQLEKGNEQFQKNLKNARGHLERLGRFKA